MKAQFAHGWHEVYLQARGLDAAQTDSIPEGARVTIVAGSLAVPRWLARVAGALR